MLDEYEKCKFCKSYDNFDGRISCFCDSHEYYEPDEQKIVAKAKEMGFLLQM
jgi:hypothetical protein